jgi:hypothetical protein
MAYLLISLKVDVDPDQTVADLKAKIEEAQGHLVASQKIIFSGTLSLY